jgi:hypothetical protein
MVAHHWTRWVAYLLSWTLVGLFFASQTYVAYKYSGGSPHLGVILKFSLSEWYIWALLAPGVMGLARRLSLERGRRVRNLAIHAVVSVGVALAHWGLNNLCRHYVLGFPGAVSLVYTFHSNLVTYWVLVGATCGYDYYVRYRQEKLHAAQLAAQLAQAQLQALRTQLHPHFLFNTLNAIATLVHRDPEAAIDRVLRDIRDARDHGARTIFLVDDNIMLNVGRFESFCHAIIDAELNKLDYFVQAMTSSIANHGKTLAPLMRRAGFRYVFLGIENILEGDLQFLRAAAKNTAREHGSNRGNATLKAIEWFHRNKMYVVGGLIVGNPDDTRESIEANLAFACRYVDWPYIQHPTPYPGTPMTEHFRERGLITNERLEEYDGTTAVVRTEHLPAKEIEYLRWKAERWMKLRHMPAAFCHDPWFVARRALAMLAHTFRGCTLASVLGLEDNRKVFERYQAIRHRERVRV